MRINLAHASAIVLLSLVLLLQCWNAPFLLFDDPLHIYSNPKVTGTESAWSLLTTVPHEETYFPITLLSYRLDRAMFTPQEPPNLDKWATGTRTMTWVYHAITALLVWRILLALGLSDLQALFGALVFAVHPTACETVCWASERKNALAGLFGLAAVLATLRLRGRIYRAPLALLLYTLALMSKPSALGLLPVIAVLEFFDASGARGPALKFWPPSRRWLDTFEFVFPLAVLSLLIAKINIASAGATVVPPPGGSIFSAVLTDSIVFCRYLFNTLLPVRLSFVYYVEPIVSLLDIRLLLYTVFLCSAIGLSVIFSANRTRATLGWLWFFLALAPNWNLVAILQVMQDRYLYLALPGLLLVLIEFSGGISKYQASIRKALLPVACAYLIALACLSGVRSRLYSDLTMLFTDTVEKEPNAAHGHFGLGLSYAQLYAFSRNDPKVDPRVREEWRQRQIKEDMAFLACPDAHRQGNFTTIALDVATYWMDQQNVDTAEKYYRMSANSPPKLKVYPTIQSAALCGLASIKLHRGEFKQGYDFANSAVQSDGRNEEARALRAVAAIGLAVSPHTIDENLVREARADLESIHNDNDLREQARQLLSRPPFQPK